MVIIETTTKEKYEIGTPARNGENYLQCPVCSSDRKKKSDKPLMFNGAKGIGKCYHCNSTFIMENKNNCFIPKPEISYKKPIWKNDTTLSDALVRYWAERGISQQTLTRMKISEGVEWMPADNKEMNTVQFNYFRDGELINVKYRTGNKHFKLHKDAELILYNLDAIKSSDECLICEGEPDCLSWIEAGYRFAVSVPNGASRETQNLKYIDNCYNYLENKKRIYISYDNDLPGIQLRDELVRRLGEERCFLIDLEGHKDANEYLKIYGTIKLLERIEFAKEIPIEGVFGVNDFDNDLFSIYNGGIGNGEKIGLGNLDDLIGWETSRLLIVTGIPGHGKSELVDEIVLRLNLMHQWKAAYFSPENFPISYHISKMMERMSGKKMDSEKMSMEDYLETKQYLDENYKFIMPKDDDFYLDNILERARMLVKKIGIRILIIDPWNRIEYQMDKGETETKYIARQLVKMTNFAKRNNILIILVAHPIKMQKTDGGVYEIPTLYNISGSANFFNMADYGICVYRFPDRVAVYVQKVKFKHLGHTGCAEFSYNINNGRYTPFDENNYPLWDNSSFLKKNINSITNVFENANAKMQTNKSFYDTEKEDDKDDFYNNTGEHVPF